MLDRFALTITKPALDSAASFLAKRGVTADQLSIGGFGFGMLAVMGIALGYSLFAVFPLLINRACDGLDGAVARLSPPSDRGVFLDITLDFLFYAGVPLAFAFCDPARNALAAAALLAAFIGTGVSFLAYAIVAEKRGKEKTYYPNKAFYYLGGLTEGTETIVCFVLMCLWPAWFSVIALVYAGMCLVTTAYRLFAGWRDFGSGRA